MAEQGSTKRRIASYLKQNFYTEEGKRRLKKVLSSICDANEGFDDEDSHCCLCIIAGGENPEEYIRHLKTYNSSPICGLVWNANFVAYRCRDCAISPSMSLCADCFQCGNHEGHDFNMFRSHAGGACDCGDGSVIKSQGFCKNHNPANPKTATAAPEDKLFLPRVVLPCLVFKLYQFLKELKLHDSSDYQRVFLYMETLCSLLNDVARVDCLRNILIDSMLSKISNNEFCNFESHSSDKDSSQPNSSDVGGIAAAIKNSVDTDLNLEQQPVTDKADYLFCVDSKTSSDSLNAEQDMIFLHYFVDTLVLLEFPEPLTTFLLHLLPDQKYKVLFARFFCMYYHKIGEILGHSLSDKLANRVLHVNVQLFSSEQLALQMVKEENLLETVCTVLVTMIQDCLHHYKNKSNELGECLTISVADCNNSVLRNNSYWPVVCDLINLLSHESVLEVFLSSDGIIWKWLYFTSFLTGMNLNVRRIENQFFSVSRTYYTAFCVEFESVAAVMWELYRGIFKLGDSKHCLKMVKKLLHLLSPWMEMVSEEPYRAAVSFHLALHRYLALFVSQSSCFFNLSIEEVLPSANLTCKLFEYPLRALVAYYEVKAGYWIYNGDEMRYQAQLYVQSSICNSMVDLDIFFVQIAACILDPDYFITLLIDRFGLRNWFRYCKTDEEGDVRYNSMKEVSMVEGFLNFLLTLLNHRVYSGVKKDRQFRKDIAVQLCVADSSHSKLALIPGRSGDMHLWKNDFEAALNEIADYQSPSFESGSMQEGVYTPKDSVWEKEFDYNHIQLRCYLRSDHQAALERYTNYYHSKKLAATAHCWPYTRNLEPLAPAFNGLLNLLHCGNLHKIIFFLLQKASDEPNSFTEEMLISVVHLLFLCLDTEQPENVQDFCPVMEDNTVAMATKCLDFLEKHAQNERNLYTEIFDSAELQTDLLKAMQRSKLYEPDPGIHSVKEVNLTLLAIIFNLCFGTMFAVMIAYVSEILGEILTPNSPTTNVRIKREAIHTILKFLPTRYYELLSRLLKFWMRASRLDGVPVNNFAFPIKGEDRIGFSILINFLTKNFNWLFEVQSSKDGYPLHALDVEFPSTSIIDNATVYVGDSGLGQNDIDAVREVEHYDSEEIPEDLIKKLVSIIECSREKAEKLLRKYYNNVEFAICMVMDQQETEGSEPDLFEKEETEQEKMETKTTLTKKGDNDVEVILNRECIISLLIKLRRHLLSSAVKHSGPGYRTELEENDRAVGDGAFFIKKLLGKFCVRSNACAKLLEKLSPSTDFHNTGQNKIGHQQMEVAAKKLKKELAAQKKKQLMAEFTRRQKLFLEKNSHVDEVEQSMDVDNQDGSTAPLNQEYDCVICGQASPSTEGRPIGLVVLMQPTTSLGHRKRYEGSYLKEEEPPDEQPQDTCIGVVTRRKTALLSIFEKVHAMKALEVGLDCGVHIQTCGHYLHVDCQQSYFKALKDEQESLREMQRVFSAADGYFTCPLCRQMGNGFLPILPDKLKERHSENIGQSAEKTLNGISSLLECGEKGGLPFLTARSLSFSLLSAAYSTLTDTLSTLLKCGGAMVTALYSDRTNKEKFTILVATLRSNLELRYLGKDEHKRQTSESSFMEALLEGLHFYCVSIESPMGDLWEQLKNPALHESRSSSSVPREKPPLLLCDVTSLLLQIFLSWPNLMVHDEYLCVVQHLFNLCYAQGILNVCFQFQGDEKTQWEKACPAPTCFEDTPDTNTLMSLVATSVANINARHERQVTGISSSVLSPKAVEASVQRFCLPFLRIASFVGHFAFKRPMPSFVDDIQAEFISLATSNGLLSEESIAEDQYSLSKSCYLKFATCHWSDAIKCWCKQLIRLMPQDIGTCKNILAETHLWTSPKLFKLPKFFDRLFDQYRKKCCSRCGKVPSNPTLCLVCGAFLCYKTTCCATRDGVFECVQHSIECGCGTGVFLVISSSVIKVIRFDRVCTWGSVYLDAFGEEDRNLRRGKPLFLSQGRFNRLEEDWLRHRFDRTCKHWILHMNNL